MISVEEAFEIYRQTLQPLPVRTVLLNKALGGVLADDIHAAVDLPLFTQSALDGYALHAGRLASVGSQGLELAEWMAVAGAAEDQPLPAGKAVRIFTGSRLPLGADAILAQEHARVVNGRVYALELPRSGQGVRSQGEELIRGAKLARRGQRVTPGLLAALAMAGLAELPLRLAPRVSVLVSGDEVVAAGEPLRPGQVYDANGPLMHAWLLQQGCPPPAIRILPDDPAAIRESLRQALAESDLVLTSGGVSVGDRDYIPEVAASLGLTRRFWKVAQKPGKPLWFGHGEAGTLLGLPGNPGAVWTCLQVHAASILDLLQGMEPPRPHWQCGLLQEAVSPDPVRMRWLRMCRRTDAQGRVLLESLKHQASHMLSNLAQADTLVWLPAREQAYAIGESVLWSAV